MDLEFFDEEKHDYFLDEYKNYSREPAEDEKEFFKPMLQEVVDKIAEVTGVSTDFKLYFAMTDEDSLEDDLPINRYVHGFSFAEWMEGFDRDVIMIRAVRDREQWKNCLINMLAHEMAHQEYYSKNESAPYSNLENLIFEGHAMNRAEQVAENLEVDWKPHYRSEEVPDIDIEPVIQALDENRSYDADNIFQNGEEPCPEAEGYQLAYLVVKEITGDGIRLDMLPNEEINKDIIEERLEELLG